MSPTRRVRATLPRLLSSWRRLPAGVAIALLLLGLTTLGSSTSPGALPVEAAALQATTIFSANFNSGTDSFTYEDDTFLDTNQPSYASGARQTSGGYGGTGGLRVTVGGVDGADIDDMSGGWTRTVTLSSAESGVALSFRYNLTQEAPYEYDEFTQVYASVDGTLYGRGEKDYIDHVGGDGQGTSARANVYDPTTGWQQYEFYVGDLSAGNHSVTLGGYNSRKTTSDEVSYIDIDDVVMTSGNDAPATSDAETLVGRMSRTQYEQDIEDLADWGDRCMMTGCSLTSWTNAQNWLEDELEDMGYDTVDRQYYTYDGTQRSNLYATKVGETTPEEMYMVGAHLDGRGGGGAADDDGSGVALLMACARELAASDVETDRSVRFLFWGNEESGLQGSSAYRADRYDDQGDEYPVGSGEYPEPTWLGLIQHDMVLYDHGVGSPGSQQSQYADMDVEYRYGSDYASDSQELAEAWHFASGLFGETYPSGIYDWSTNTDDTSFHDYVASISIRENRRGVSGEWINPYYHTSSDAYSSYDEADFDLGFDTARVTCGLVFQLAGAEIVSGNEPPTADDKSSTTDEDNAVGVTVSGSDPDGDPLTFSVATQPSNGSASIAGTTATYTPNANFNGTDSFTYRAYDGTEYSDPATVTITVNAVNDAPVAANDAATTDEDTAAAITLAATDVDLDTLTYAVVSGPANGALTGTAPNLTYTPNENWYGSDSFTFKANDGTVDSNVATVSITVSPVNDPPTADDQSVATDEDNSVGITLTGDDVENGSGGITFSVTGAPAHGTLTGTAPSLTYTPSANYYGADSFTFVTNDGSASSSAATVTITVNPVNDAPVADDKTVSVDEDGFVAITYSGSDIDGDAITFSVDASPAHGTWDGSTYTPDANYFGSDSFTYKANDGLLDSAAATVSITVNSVNDIPTADDDAATVAEDTSVAITLTGDDLESGPDGITFSVTGGPAHGSLTGTAPDVTYTPDADFNGADEFTFITNDGEDNSAAATVSITVTPVNDPPVADDQSVSTTENTPLAITLSGTDVDGDSLTYSVATVPTHGTVSGTPPNVTYTPDTGYTGPDSFTFNVSDGSESDSGTISISVDDINYPPTANDFSFSEDEDSPHEFTLTGSDPDGDPLTFIVVSQPSNGELGGTAPELYYTPDADWYGSDSFTFKVNDGYQDSNVATVSITIDSINDPPVAQSQSVTTDEDTAIDITLTATDIDSASFTYISLNGVQHGTLTGTPPDMTYTPDPNWYGTDSFTFVATDDEGATSNYAVVTVVVTSVNDLPEAWDLGATILEEESEWVELWATDVEGDPLTFHIASSPGNGTLSGTAPNLLYTPNVDYYGADSFTYYANDGTDDSELATVTFTVLPVNDPPVAYDQSVSTDEDVALAITLSATDVDGDPLTYAVLDGVGYGTLTGTPPSLTYTPNANWSGSDSFTFEASDDSGATSNYATVAITVDPVNDKPVAQALGLTTIEDTSDTVELFATDIEGDPLTYHVDTGPANGSLSGTAPYLTYTPDANFYGSDSFTYYANDGSDDSDSATVSITVIAVNDAPVADDQSVTTDQDTPVSVTLTGSDVEGSPLTYSIGAGPSHGSLSGTPPSVTYTPDTGYYGADSFTFTVSDGSLTSSPATVSITVNEIVSGPVFEDDFESDQGWTEDPNGTDTARTGMWERGDPEGTYSSGPKQLGTTASGSNDLVTGRLAGRNVGSYDIDGGVTSIESPEIDLPSGRDLELSFEYYLAHLSNSSSSDFLRVKVVGDTTETVFEELGANNDDDAVWDSYSADISDFAGQTVTLLIEAADASNGSLVEAAIDDVLIEVVQPATTILEADFDSSAESFTYDDDEFRGTNEPSYADGSWVSSGGYSGGALEVEVGAIDDDDIYGMSGGWSRTFTLSSAMDVSVRFYHKLTIASEYESDEYGETLLSLDGSLYGLGGNSYVAHIAGNGNGGSPDTTGWVEVEVEVGTLSAGSHTLTLGAYNNKKTLDDEWTEVLVDELAVLGR